ncbi:MAG: oligosaccharide flippase family protein [Solirubrobacteraceae bacterium]
MTSPSDESLIATSSATGPGGGILTEEHLHADEVKRRAAGGAVLVALRGGGLQVLSFLANIVLARLLLPQDFGLVALGNTIIIFGDLMANSGASQTLIRSPETPHVDDLRAVTAFQLALTGLLTAVVIAVTLPLGRAGGLAAVMALSLPLLAARTPPMVMLERSLSYGKLVTVEITENLVYYAWAIGTVIAGFGVWGLATGVVVRVLVGTVMLVAVGPVRFMWPKWSWARIKPVLGFGARLQATGAANFVRDQMLNVAIAALSGVSTLGLWTLASRALAVPMIVFEALWRVSYPAMARLLALGESTRDIVERSVGLVATAGGAAICPVAATAPALIPVVFGPRWAHAADALPLSCLGLLIVGPASVASAGFLAASGDAKTILRGALLHTAAQFAVALPLLLVLPLWAVGLGVLAATIVEATVLGGRAAKVTGARMIRPMAAPLIAAVAGGAAGWLLATSGHKTLLTAVGAGALADAVYLAILGLFARKALLETVRMIRRAVHAGR